MKTKPTRRAPKTVKKPPAVRSPGKFLLRLFVAGATARSRQAILRVQQLSKANLKSGCTLEVVDIYQQPKLACEHQIVATPTLIMELPKPVRRFIGNLVNVTGLFVEFDLLAEAKITR